MRFSITKTADESGATLHLHLSSDEVADLREQLAASGEHRAPPPPWVPLALRDDVVGDAPLPSPATREAIQTHLGPARASRAPRDRDDSQEVTR